MKEAIRVEGLQKSYGTDMVLTDVTFSVAQGEMFALLGTNGAGKTTTLECVEGLRQYDGGTIHMEGRYGVQLQSSSIPQNMRADEALLLFAKWQHTQVDWEKTARLGVRPFLKKQYKKLSTGQKRRLHLALALLGDPDIIFLDEPTAGLDVEGRVSIHAEIERLKAQGKTIVLASHDMAEVERLCDKIGILKNGAIAFLGTPAQLLKTQQNQFVLKMRFSEEPDVKQMKGFTPARSNGGYYAFTAESIENALLSIAECCKLQHIAITDICVEHNGMEERFLEIAKEEA